MEGKHFETKQKQWWICNEPVTKAIIMTTSSDTENVAVTNAILCIDDKFVFILTTKNGYQCQRECVQVFHEGNWR